jgi:hypothetical protein
MPRLPRLDGEFESVIAENRPPGSEIIAMHTVLASCVSTSTTNAFGAFWLEVAANSGESCERERESFPIQPFGSTNECNQQARC